MDTIEFTFDQSPEMTNKALENPKLGQLFSHWKYPPSYLATIDVDSPNQCFVSVTASQEGHHEAADIVEAFLTGFFASYGSVFETP